MAAAILTRRAVLPVLLAAGIVLTPPSVLHAEAPESPAKKSIYDDLSSSTPTPRPTKDTANPSPGSQPARPTLSPTFTDLVAERIRIARLFAYAHVTAGEDRVNATLTSFLRLENSFTSTIASLAPPRSSGERLMPGAIYVLVAAMAGSIVTRNRNILLRASVPLAVGIGAGWVVLPVTMRNVGDLAWQFEERVPVIKGNHLRIKAAADQAWRTAREKGGRAFQVVEETMSRERHRAETWVRSGK